MPATTDARQTITLRGKTVTLCPACGEYRALAANGTIRAHYWGTPIQGSGKKPLCTGSGQ